MLNEGDLATDFELPTGENETVSLRRLRGKKVVLYFYPKDNTPGCTREACDFRDSFARISAAGTVVIGVSKDSLASHRKFSDKYDLPFVLASDPDSRVAAAYGAFGEKTLYGKKTTGTIRSTFLIDERGRIARIWRNVKVAGHVDQVLAALAGKPAPPAARKKAPTKKKAARKTAGR